MKSIVILCAAAALAKACPSKCYIGSCLAGVRDTKHAAEVCSEVLVKTVTPSAV